MTKTVRVRFAPSPTGHLHVGGARTALYNYLYAKKTGGTFVLRIEDTDLERSEEQYTQAILQGMAWLGMHADEEPLYQSKRTELYLSHLKKLEDSDRAYRCYCTSDEIETMRAEARSQGKKPKYNGKCREQKESPEVGRPFCLRFKAIDTGVTTVDDLIKGKVDFNNEELDDFIIARTDGSPTYQFVVVVDDADMKITHVIRGDDHLNNTPKQIQLYKALGFDLPLFAHIPMILGADKKRLSKRHGATSVMAYQEAGILSEALVNYLVRLGWSHGDQEIFSSQELQSIFDIADVGKSPAVFDTDKLNWLNQHYLKTLDGKQLLELARPFLLQAGIEISEDDFTIKALLAYQEKVKNLVELSQSVGFFFQAPSSYDEKPVTKFLNDAGQEILKKLATGLESLEDYSIDGLALFLKSFSEKQDLKFKLIAQPLRIAMTGSTQSPSIDLTLSILGKDEVLKRISTCLEKI